MKNKLNPSLYNEVGLLFNVFYVSIIILRFTRVKDYKLKKIIKKMNIYVQ